MVAVDPAFLKILERALPGFYDKLQKWTLLGMRCTIRDVVHGSSPEKAHSVGSGVMVSGNVLRFV